MEASIRFAGGIPDWPAVRALLAADGHAVQVRMIDGELAFPDEQPPAAWRELRLAIEGNMVTLRREPDAIAFVVWGNADAGMVRARDLLMKAFEKASANGT